MIGVTLYSPTPGVVDLDTGFYYLWNENLGALCCDLTWYREGDGT